MCERCKRRYNELQATVSRLERCEGSLGNILVGQAYTKMHKLQKAESRKSGLHLRVGLTQIDTQIDSLLTHFSRHSSPSSSWL